jgi:surface antigen
MAAARLVIAILCVQLALPALANGNPLYASLAEEDQARAAAAVQEALETLPSAQTHRWANPASGASGYVTPQRTFKIKSGTFCREYQEAVVTPAGAETRLFTACRRPADGFWVMIANRG